MKKIDKIIQECICGTTYCDPYYAAKYVCENMADEIKKFLEDEIAETEALCKLSQDNELAANITIRVIKMIIKDLFEREQL